MSMQWCGQHVPHDMNIIWYTKNRNWYGQTSQAATSSLYVWKLNLLHYFINTFHLTIYWSGAYNEYIQIHMRQCVCVNNCWKCVKSFSSTRGIFMATQFYHSIRSMQFTIQRYIIDFRMYQLNSKYSEPRVSIMAIIIVAITPALRI